MGDRAGALDRFERTLGIVLCKEEAARSLRAIAAEIAGQDSVPGPDGQRRAGLLYDRIVAALRKDEHAFAASADALAAARKARAAPTPDLRDAWLSDYERAHAEAYRRLDRGALQEARDDHASTGLLLAGLPADRLTPETLRRVRHLHRLSRRRVAALEAAEKNLRDAEGLAALPRGRKTAQHAP
jgi:hypothetical protein